MAEINRLTNVRRFLFKRIKIIRVRAIPPFLCLRRGFVQQQKLLTSKGIDASRRSPFTIPNVFEYYLNLSEKCDFNISPCFFRDLKTCLNDSNSHFSIKARRIVIVTEK